MQRATVLGITIAIAFGAAGQALAVDEPANVVKYRQAIMSAIGGHMGALSAMAKGEISYTDEAQAHAQAIHQMSQTVDRLWPEGTGQGELQGVETRALPDIWHRGDEFQEAITRLQDESQKLVQLTEGGEFEQAAFAQQVASLGRNACGDCHEPFRAEQN